jgi:hypothetical protein
MGDDLVRGRTSGRASQRSWAACCAVALAVSALVATSADDRADAIAGDPVTVSTTAELTAAIAAGGVIYLASPEFVVDSALQIRKAGTELRAASPGDSTIRFQGSYGRPIEVFARNVVIDGVKVTGGRYPFDDGGGGIEVESGASLTLSRSWVTDNRDDFGGGILNEGTITIVDSTISDNTASLKGGGLLNEGTATVTNSTIEGNTSLWGSGVASFSTINLNHTTIVRNVTTTSSNSYGALQRLNGTFNVTYSIIGANMRTNGSDARNCAGTVRLRDLNLVSSATGCSSSGTVLTGGPLVGPLQDNGGPTPTAAPLDFSKALDAVAVSAGSCASGVTADQRGVARPSSTGCELGSFETAPLGVSAGLTVDTSAYAPLPAGVVEVGATSVPSELIAGELAARSTINDDGTVNSSGLRSIGLRSIGLRSITLEDIGLRSIDPASTGLRSIELKANGLRSIGLRSIGLRSIGLRSIGLRSIGLRSIPLSEIPLLEDGGWSTLLEGTDFENVPLQSITLEDISALDDAGNSLVDGLTLESIDLSSTGLRSIGLRSILLSGIGLRSIPLPLEAGETAPGGDYAAAWCNTLFGPDLCTAAFVEEIGNAELWEAQLAGGNIDQEKILEVALSGLTSTGLRSIGLRSIGLRSIFLENTGLRSIGLRSIGLRSIDTDGDGIADTGIESIVRCTTDPTDPANPCRTDPSNTLTLGDILAGCLPADVLDQGFTDPASCLLQDDADVGLLLDLLGAPDEFGITLLDGLTLYDILFAFVPPEDIPWEVVDLDGASLQNIAEPAQPTFGYTVDVTVANGPAVVTVDLVLPQGFAIAAGANAEAATWCSGAACTAVTPSSPVELANPVFEILGVGSGSYQLVVPVRAGSTTGPSNQFEAVATVTAVGANGAPPVVITDPVGVEVVQADTGGPRPIAPALSDGELQLGYIGGTDEVDAFAFEAPAGTTGASARILLSNIPDGVDYDLTVYGPRPTSLRGDPTTELSGLGDLEFDLDPEDDVLPTDVVNDIAVDINEIAPEIDGLEGVAGRQYALRDISSRRSNNDEEATLPALVEGETYVVVVSGYFGDISPEPYGLRLRLDRRTALPQCATTIPYPGPSAPGAVPTALDPNVGTKNTLYITNGARLEAESPGELAQVVAAIGATDSVNGVTAGLLFVDDLPEWTVWNADSCSPDARNAVVKAIGDRIDDVPGTIENIVIVGGDGVIPMAAVPDLTEYSNESTFAREVLSPTPDGLRSNAVSGTVGSGYLLSDDPYATDAGISVQKGDHELYVPDRNIGRLVETADEIIGQLENFTNYGGRLDPSTFRALVTGYDFLDDGAQAVADELRLGAGFTIDQLAGSPTWNRDTYLDLFLPDGDGGDPETFTPKDYSVFSPNAHYDFESLLPAAADAAEFFSDRDLVTTADLAVVDPSDPIDPTQPLVPTGALGFTVGCHAGLSVSDVQLGFGSADPALDWAQLYSQASTQWIGHTTYGYGDTVIVAYSERLAQLFAGNVASLTAGAPGAPSSLGAAVRVAKRDYLDGTFVLTPYDEKILQSWTYYGVPMYTIGTPLTAATSASEEETTKTTDESTTDESTTDESTTDESTTDESTTDESTTDESTTDTTITTTPSEPAGLLLPRLLPAVVTEGPVTFGDPDPSSGRVPIVIDLGGNALQRRDTADGSYYTANSITVAQYRPVQPLVDVPIPLSGPFGGFLITGLTSEDLPETYVPFYARPIVDNGVDEGRIVVGDGAFPATLQRISGPGPDQRLLVAAGQYEDGQRLFRQIRGELLPRTSLSDTDAPRFLDVVGTNIADVGTSGRGIQFNVRTDDGADGTNARVVIVYREPGENQWRTLELSKQSETNGVATWFGTAPLTSTDPALLAEFFAQSVDAAGNVGITSNKIENFLAVNSLEPPTGTGPAIVYSGPDENQVDGRYFASGAPFQITPTGTFFSIDSGPGLPYNPATGIIISAASTDTGPSYDPDTGALTIDDGPHVILAEDADGLQTSRFFILDADAPNVTFSPIADWTSNDVTDLQVSASDGPGVGVATLEVCVDAQCASGTDDGDDGLFQATAPAIRADGSIGEVVTKSVVATATDLLGNATTETREVKVDKAAPVLTVTKDPESVWANGDVTVKVNATDVGSGLDTVCIDTGDVSGCVEVMLDELGNYEFVIDTDGTTIITAIATDNAGNESTSTVAVQLDTVAPVITLDAPDDWQQGPVDVNVNVTDDRSGVATVTIDTGDGPQIVDLDTDGNYLVEGIDIEGDGTVTMTVDATDNAGNNAVQATANVDIDNLAPTITFAGVPTAEWVNGDVTVTVTADDGTGSGIATVRTTLCYDAGCAPPTTTSGPSTGVSLTVPPGSARSTTITVEVTDRAGNTTNAGRVVQIDKAAPTAALTISNFDDGFYVNGEDVTATFSCADLESGVDSCALLDGTTVLWSSESGEQTEYVIDTSQSGTKSLSVRAIDKVGNELTTTPQDIVVGFRTCLNYDPNKAKKAGSAYSISITLCDSDGTPVPASGITLTALTVDGMNDPGPGAPGGSNPAYVFSNDGNSTFSYTIKTTGLAKGNHTLYFTTLSVPDRDVPLEDLQGLATNSAPFKLK